MANFKTRLRMTLAAAGLAAVSLPAAAFAQESMNERQLLGLFPGTFEVVAKGVSMQIVAYENGLLIARGSNFKDIGRWSLRNGQLCIAMTMWGGGRPYCSAVVADNGWYLGQGVKFRKS